MQMRAAPSEEGISSARDSREKREGGRERVRKEGKGRKGTGRRGGISGEWRKEGIKEQPKESQTC